MLGEGARIPGGWQLSGLTLATNPIIRARGFVAAGFRNSSSWLVESVLHAGGPPDIVWPPANRANNAGTVATFSVQAVSLSQPGCQ